MSNDGHCLPEPRQNFILGNVEHEEIGTCARIEISQDADNAGQKVKWFLKVHKTLQTFVGSIFLIIFSPSFYSCLRFTNFSMFTP